MNCQTQKALLGHLGDSEKMFKPSLISANPEAHASFAIQKAEPKSNNTEAESTPVATKSQPTPATINTVPTVSSLKANKKPTPIMMETKPTAACAQIELETTVIPTTTKDLPVIEEKQPSTASRAEPNKTDMSPFQETTVTSNVVVPNTSASKVVTVTGKEEAVKIELSVTEHPRTEETKPNLSKVKVEAHIAVASTSPESETTVVTTSPVFVEGAMSATVQSTDMQPKLPAPESKQSHHIRLTEPIKEVEVQPKSHKHHLEAKPDTAADSKDMATKVVEEIIDTVEIASAPETQVSTKSIIIKVRFFFILVLFVCHTLTTIT